MKYSLLFFIAIIIYLKSNGQGDLLIQYKLIKANIKKQNERLRQYDFVDYHKQFKNDTFFIDYILRKYSGSKGVTRFISNRYYLEKFSDIYLRQDAARLLLEKKDTIEINLVKEYSSLSKIGIVEYDSTYTGRAFNPDYDFKFIKSVNGKFAYGFSFDTNSVTKIKLISIKINRMETIVDKTVFEDLYFPNFCEVEYAIKPIEAFLSPDKRFIYLYIFGGQAGQTFFCKIIFDIKTKSTIGRIIADSKELSAYQCLYPKSFIGF